MIRNDDKRPIGDSAEFVVERESERDWHYCKYCYQDAPTFILTEGRVGRAGVYHRMRCCWQCGAGLEILHDSADSVL